MTGCNIDGEPTSLPYHHHDEMNKHHRRKSGEGIPSSSATTTTSRRLYNRNNTAPTTRHPWNGSSPSVVGDYDDDDGGQNKARRWNRHRRRRFAMYLFWCNTKFVNTVLVLSVTIFVVVSGWSSSSAAASTGEGDIAWSSQPPHAVAEADDDNVMERGEQEARGGGGGGYSTAIMGGNIRSKSDSTSSTTHDNIPLLIPCFSASSSGVVVGGGDGNRRGGGVVPPPFPPYTNDDDYDYDFWVDDYITVPDWEYTTSMTTREALLESGLPWVQKRSDDSDKRDEEEVRSADDRETLPTTVRRYTNEVPEVDIDIDPYYAFDDDIIRGNREDVTPSSTNCRRTSFHRLHHPTCNILHERDLLHDKSRLIGIGLYRNSFMVESTPFHSPLLESAMHYSEFENGQNAILKSMRLEDTYELDPELGVNGEQVIRLEMQRLDTLVMDLLSSSSRSVNLYGHCGMGSIMEYVPIPIERDILPVNDGKLPIIESEDDEESSTDEEAAMMEENDTAAAATPLNNMTISKKLHLALEMAECLADMHGYKDGVILHVDVQLSQFMRSYDGILKIIDFNRAEVLLYDEVMGEYCRFTNGGVYGDLRGPEEVIDGPLNEKVDVYSLGNNFYSILTGLRVYHDMDDDATIQEYIQNGDTPYLNEEYYTKRRSYGERALIHLIQRCWTYDPDERIDIFEIIDYLKKTIRLEESVEDVEDYIRDAYD